MSTTINSVVAFENQELIGASEPIICTNATTLKIQISGEPMDLEMVVKGKILGGNDYENLAIIKDSTLDVLETITTTGLYTVDITGCINALLDITALTSGTVDAIAKAIA